MPPPVEAQSLSSLIQIASNPPRYPRNPAEQKRDPLVLYIARVPGLQDIILTPLKPDLKNLKEIDVASCLYYLHRDLPSDAALVDQDSTPTFNPPPAPPQIARKPLPSLSAPAVAEREATNLAALESLNETRTSYLASSPPPPSRSPPLHPNPAPPIEPSAAALPRRPLDPSAATLPRRPLGPRPLSIDPATLPPRLPPRDGDTENVPPTPPRPATATSPITKATTLARTRANSLFPPIQPIHSKPPAPYTITLIRRDPSTTAQWTIGRIVITPHATPSITIHLTTPGYTLFTSPPSPQGFTRSISHPTPRPRQRHRHKHMRTHSANPPITATDKQTPNAYHLSTPWNTPLSFTTGPSGRSLRCVHTLPGDDNNGAMVSELRYNTPISTTAFWRPHARPKSAPSSPLTGTQNPSAFGGGEGIGGGKTDLDLGREKAGGGRGGARAKLGKLVVFDEGIKMLDLVVAGNMGVWWEGWGA